YSILWIEPTGIPCSPWLGYQTRPDYGTTKNSLITDEDNDQRSTLHAILINSSSNVKSLLVSLLPWLKIFRLSAQTAIVWHDVSYESGTGT
ncbi:MAG: hypothetical protein M1456_06840, partial [Actinobacteria bacterium]|nr:hypothetical protein [Actinomycetota bacterium]